MRFDTKCVRAGITPDLTTGAIVPPIYQTATYVLGGITLGPVVLVPKLKLDAYVNLSLEPKLEMGATTTLSSTVGFTYRPDEDLVSWASASVTPGIIDPKIELGIGSPGRVVVESGLSTGDVVALRDPKQRKVS